MLYTNLNHIETANDFNRVLNKSTYAVVIYGRMDNASVATYRIAKSLEQEFIHVDFFDMELGNPEFKSISILPDIGNNEISPAIVFCKQGSIVNIEWGKLTANQLINNINREFIS